MSNSKWSRRRNRNKSRLSVESLEDRRLLAADLAFRDGGGTGFQDVTFDDTTAQGWTTQLEDSNPLYPYQGGSANAKRVGLVGVKGLFADGGALDAETSQGTLQINSAKLKLKAASAGNGASVELFRITTDWLDAAAGSNETGNQTWQSANGRIGTSDYTGPGVAKTWASNATNEFDVTTLVQDMIATGDFEVGLVLNSQSTINFHDSEATLANRPVLEFNYEYVQSGGSSGMVNLREGGGTGFDSVTFDDTTAQGWDNNLVDSNPLYPYQGGSANAKRVGLVAIADLFSASGTLPATSGGQSLTINSATLTLHAANPGNGASIDVYRVGTEWLDGPAGTNETGTQVWQSATDVSAQATMPAARFLIAGMPTPQTRLISHR